MNEYKQMIEEKDYCDQSELLISEYSSMQTLDFQQQLQFMNKWARDETQHTLLITGAEQSGKKTLLCSFLRENKIAHPDWLHISNFATITPIYSNILYKIMVQLRNHYKIEQKVDLNEQKLRRYFKYWLEVTSQFLQKQYLGYNRREVPKVVIILQGIDLCVDSKGNPVEQQFWLPSKIPINIKFIITTKNSSITPFIDCQVLRHHLSKERKDKIIKKCSTTVQTLAQQVTELTLYHLHIVDQMIKVRPQIKFQGLTFIRILEQYMNAVAGPGLSSEEIRSLLYTLTLTRKGLKLRWVKRIINITTQKWQLFCKLFSFLIVQSSGYYIICNRGAKTAISQIVDENRQKIKTYRLSIFNSIKNEPLRLRGLEEIVYQLLLSENYSQLKEVISRIQNFIMLYTPFSKQLLCQCWVRLEQLQQFDPVFQYNKAIQAYASHYYPKEEQLYKIIFQVSMFFKEYAQFQNAKTPKFRHPLIKGEIDQFEEIGIYDELKSLAMIGKCKTYKLKPLEKNISLKQPCENKEKALKKGILDKNELSKAIQDTIQKKGKAPIKTDTNDKGKMTFEKSAIETREIISTDDSDINERPLTSQLNTQENQGGMILFNIEELNVGIISNQEKFRQFFTDEMKEYLQNYFAPLKKNIFKEKQLTFETEQSDNQQESCKQKQQRQFKIDIQKLKESFILKKYKQYLQENYHKTGEQVSYYYYKQWIWLQFPWICQTVKHIYSHMMTECLPGSIRFMSPQMEFTLIKQVIKIARNAKQSKSGIYTQKKIEILPIKHSNIKFNEFNSANQTQKLDQSMCHTKRASKEIHKQKKYKINLYKIEELIAKEKQFESKMKEKSGDKMMRQLRGGTSLPNLHLFVTQTAHKQSSNLFPILHKSKFAVESGRRGQKQNNPDARNYTVIIRKYNELKHQNQMLIEKIEQMKRLQSKVTDKSEQHLNIINSNIAELEIKKASLQKSYKNQQDLRKKLEVIIKVCDLNKMYGSETDYLSTYLNSLKQMIKIEDGRTVEIKDRIFGNIDETRKNIKLLKQKRKEIKGKRQQNLPPYINIGTDSTNPPYGIADQHCIEKDILELSRFIKNKPKKTKTKERHFLSSQDYEILEEQIGIKFQDPNNQKKIQDFVDKVQKLKTLKLKNSDLNTECQEKTKENKEIKAFVQSLIQGVEGEKQIHIASLLVEKKRELFEIKKRNQLLQNALKSINSHQNE